MEGFSTIAGPTHPVALDAFKLYRAVQYAKADDSINLEIREIPY